MKSGIDNIGIAVVFACHDGSGKFLLQKRDKKCRDEQGVWSFGGGALEFGENIETRVLKEVKEEYGCVGIIQERLYPYTFIGQQDGVKKHWIYFPFIIKVDPKQVGINDKERIVEIGWFELNKLPSPLHTALAGLLRVRNDYFSKYTLI